MERIREYIAGGYLKPSHSLLLDKDGLVITSHPASGLHTPAFKTVAGPPTESTAA